MLTAVYGSSEYAQALSRTGSIFGNIFIVNKECSITNLVVDQSGFKSVDCHFNTTPLVSSKGLIVGPDYHDFVL
jgi:RAB protein geranylgeranyltransferase component A